MFNLVKQNAGLIGRWSLRTGCVYYDMLYQSCIKMLHGETCFKQAPALGKQFGVSQECLLKVGSTLCTFCILTSWINVKYLWFALENCPPDPHLNIYTVKQQNEDYFVLLLLSQDQVSFVR